MDMLGGPDEWTFWGTPNCGKGQPQQIGHTGHPAAPARFRGVRVGVRGMSGAATGDRRAMAAAERVARRWSAVAAPARREAEVDRRPGDAGADPVRQHLHPPERGRGASATSRCGWRSTAGRAAVSARRADRRRALARLVDGRVAAARVGPVDPDWPGLTPPTAGARRSTTGTRRPRRATPGRPGRAGRRVRRRGRRPRDGRLLLDRRRSTRAFANSAGQRRRPAATTAATLDGDRPDGRPPTAAARSTSVRARRPRRRAPVGERGRPKARDRARTRSTSSPGRYEVVLEPSASRTSLDVPAASTASTARRSRRAARSSRLGEPQFDPSITLARRRHRPGHARASRSTPRARRSGRVDLVARGVTRGARCTRRRTARAAGGGTRARATRSRAARRGARSAANLVPGRRRPDRPTSSSRGVERGAARHRLLVHPGPRPADAGRDRADAQRRVAHRGRPGRAGRCSNLRFTQSYPGGARPGRGPGDRSASGRWSRRLRTATCLVPSLHLASWNFTGGAKG